MSAGLPAAANRSSRANVASGAELLKGLRISLQRAGVGVDAHLRDIGQVEAAARRATGEAFDLSDHLRGLVFAQLSDERPWEPIARNRQHIAEVFLGFNPDALLVANPDHLLRGLRALDCGNRRDEAQIEALPVNILTLRRIEQRHGSVDAFVCSAAPFTIARSLWRFGPCRLFAVNQEVALEYLKNVGISACNPDAGVRRALSRLRLGYSDGTPTEAEAFGIVEKLATEAGVTTTYLDNLLHMFCSPDFADICGASARCAECALNVVCDYSPDSPARAESLRAEAARMAELQGLIDEREAEVRRQEARAASLDATCADLHARYHHAVTEPSMSETAADLWRALQRARGQASTARLRASSIRHDILGLQEQLAEYRRHAGPPDHVVNYAPFHGGADELIPEGPVLTGRTCLRCGQPLTDMRNTFCSRRCAGRFHAGEQRFYR